MIREPCPDPWPDGGYLDDYLSASDREGIGGLLESHGRIVGEALRYERDGKVESAFERWQKVYRHTFPLYESPADQRAVRPAQGGPFTVRFANDGGPMIVLPRELLAYWEGGDPPSGGRLIKTAVDHLYPDFAGTDYARACAAGPGASVVEVGAGHGVILHGWEEAPEVGELRWLRLPGRRDVLLLITVESEEGFETPLIDELRRVGDEGWHLVVPALRVAGDDLLLLHAASPGREITERESGEWAGITGAIPCRIAAGTYALEEQAIAVPTKRYESRFIALRFRPLAT